MAENQFQKIQNRYANVSFFSLSFIATWFKTLASKNVWYYQYHQKNMEELFKNICTTQTWPNLETKIKTATGFYQYWGAMVCGKIRIPHHHWIIHVWARKTRRRENHKGTYQSGKVSLVLLETPNSLGNFGMGFSNKF